MPDGEQCHHRLAPSELPTGIAPVTCNRPVWEGADQCVWHADSDDKTESDLPMGELDEDTRIDGAYLRDISFSDGASFEGCNLYNTDFSESKLHSANFQNVTLIGADFESAELNHAEFRDNAVAKNVSFKRASLIDTRFNGSSLTKSCFEGCDALAVQFEEAKLMEADFQNADMRDADFRKANLRSACLVNTKLLNAELFKANIERANLTRADLRDARISDIKTHESDLREVRVDHRTDFGDLCYYEKESDEVCVEFVDEPRFDAFSNILPQSFKRFLGRNPHLFDSNEESDSLKKAIWTYRDFQRVTSENALPDIRRKFSIREKHAIRKSKYSKGKWVDWFRLVLSHRGMLYGESPGHVLGSSLVCVAVFSVFYGITGLESESGEIYKLTLHPEFSLEAFSSLLQFSITRFLTASNSAFNPLGFGGLIATIESAFGAFLIALFVFVLGRRATQ